jgi:hypothetical protein
MNVHTVLYYNPEYHFLVFSSLCEQHTSLLANKLLLRTQMILIQSSFIDNGSRYGRKIYF